MYFNGDFTITAWVNVLGQQYLATLFDCGTSQVGINEIVLLMSGPDDPEASFLYGSSSVWKEYPADVFGTNQWTHLATSVQATTGKTYINAVLSAQFTVSSIASVTRTDCYIGKGNWLTPYQTSALAYIDDFAIFNVALSATNVATVMNLSN